MQRRTIIKIFGMDVPTATAEDTIIAKLEWAKLGASDLVEPFAPPDSRRVPARMRTVASTPSQGTATGRP